MNHDHIKRLKLNDEGYLRPFIGRVDRVQVDVRTTTLFGVRRFPILHSTFPLHRKSFNRIAGFRTKVSRIQFHSDNPSEQFESEIKLSEYDSPQIIRCRICRQILFIQCLKKCGDVNFTVRICLN